jgi:spore germination cell wall hydrolase CwlJ-like protein
MIDKIIVSFFLLFLTLPIFHSVYQYSVKTTIVEQLEQVETVKNPVNARHLKCLATGIYYEAKGEPLLGQVAVARVIMNRVLHGFGKDPCAVVYQTATKTDEDGEQIKLCQFSWVCDGKKTPTESNPAYVKATSIARQVLEEDKWREVLPNNTLFFHNLTAAPRWTYKQVTTIGNHIFYSKGREKTISNSTTDK